MDSYLLTQGGSTVDLGSYVRADPGPDWGTRDLLKAVYAENSMVQGGRLAYETVGVRKLQFPLILPSGGAGLTLAGLESLLALLARPGAMLDVKPQGVATGDMVRFDVLTGRWEPDPNIRHWEIGVRLGTLKLDTQPFAYLPTWVTLASAASVGLPGQITIPGASVLGDMPGFARLTVQPTNPAETVPHPGAWFVDALAWSLGARPSFTGFLTGGSWIAAIPSSSYETTPIEAGVNPTYLRFFLSPTSAGWTQIAHFQIPQAIEPAYRGRHRAFLYMGNDGRISDAIDDFQFSVDAVISANPSAPMASAQPIATLSRQVNASVFSPQLLDLGEIVLPPVASGAPQDTRLRVWMNSTSFSVNAFIRFAGMHLSPIDGPHGIQNQNMTFPENSGAPARLFLDGRDRNVLVAELDADIGTSLPVQNALESYRGGFPMVDEAAVQIDLVAGQRRSGNNYLARVAPIRSAVHVSYQPRFLFLKGEV